ncbi:zinc finger protein 441-like isoform X2 [Nasonia vitripennis]|nr:zinc finger protein 441-like isoform X2 [Nasonia vitripennis]XP_008207205.1 zinc finger protein 441-like isoform X2 [Nasonia vitripennis]XP_016841541.1 zinc finger protein 441-like isoform X2 [Nasonia vitripennis]
MFKEELDISDCETSYIDVCDDDKIVLAPTRKSSVIDEASSDSDDDSVINVCDSDAELSRSESEVNINKSSVNATSTTNSRIDTSMVRSTDTTTKSMHSDNKENLLLEANSKTRKKRRREFSTKNLYAYYCETCDKFIKKINGRKITNCSICRDVLVYRCLNCQNEYRSYGGVYMHLKENNCFGVKNEVTENFSNTANSSSKFSSCSKQIEPSTSKSIDNERLCPKCGETVVNGCGPCDGEHLFQCFVCVFRSCHKSTLMHHIDTVHSDSKLIPQSQMTLVGKVLLHCNVCDHTVSDCEVKYNRRLNCKLCNSPMHYVCLICKKQYVSANSVYKHLYFECNVQPKFQCHKCDYRAKQKGNLLTHIERKHTAKRCRGCGKMFDNYISCRKHQMKKCKVTYKCRYCKYTCKFITQLKNHVRLEHKSRYKCRNCGKKYKNLSALQVHVNDTCGQVTTFECDICGYYTLQKGRLAQHIKQVHNF